MQEPRASNGPVVVVVSQPGQQETSSTYSMSKCMSGQLMGLGLAQATVGLCCIIIQGVILGKVQASKYTKSSLHVHGFWTGALFLIAGILGFLGGFGKAKYLVIGFNVLSIISAVLASILLIISSVSAGVFHYGEMLVSYFENDRVSLIEFCRNMYPLEVALVALSLVEMTCAIYSSVLCCAIGACGCNCGSSPQNPVQVQLISLADQQQQSAIAMNTVEPNSLIKPQQKSTIMTNTDESNNSVTKPQQQPAN